MFANRGAFCPVWQGICCSHASQDHGSSITSGLAWWISIRGRFSCDTCRIFEAWKALSKKPIRRPSLYLILHSEKHVPTAGNLNHRKRYMPNSELPRVPTSLHRDSVPVLEQRQEKVWTSRSHTKMLHSTCTL